MEDWEESQKTVLQFSAACGLGSDPERGDMLAVRAGEGKEDTSGVISCLQMFISKPDKKQKQMQCD